MKCFLVQSFDVDGELAATTREECFSLGVEWGIAWQLTKGSAPFVIVIHGENKTRIVAMLEARRRRVSVQENEGWATVAVEGLE